MIRTRINLSVLAIALSFFLHAQSSEYYFDLGNKSLQSHKNHEAIEYYKQAIRADSSVWVYHYNCGLAYYYISDYEKSILCFDKAHSLESDNMKVLFNRGNVKDALGDYKGALEDFEVVLTKQGGSWQLFNSMGIAYDNLKEYEKALKYFSESIALKANNSAAYDNRAMVKRKMGDMTGCCEDLKLAIKYTEYGKRAQMHFDEYCK